MIARDVRDTLASLDGRLDDVRREAVWRAIDRDVNEPAATVARSWWWRRRGFTIPMVAFAAVAAAAAILWLRSGPEPATNQSTELMAAAGQTTKLERDGATLTLVGPGAVSITPARDGTLGIRVARGTLLAERTDTAPALAIAAGSNTTVTRDRTFAVHVSPTTVVLGAGAAATQIIERYVVREPSPPPPIVTPLAPEPPKPPAPPPAEPSAPRAAVPHVDTAAPTTPRAAPVLPEIRVEPGELYHRAEVALQAHDASAARDLLERLLREYPDHTLVDAARYDLALIALAAGERDQARTLLDEIIERGRDAAVRTAAKTLRAKRF
jgi:hypothetical protein